MKQLFSIYCLCMVLSAPLSANQNNAEMLQKSLPAIVSVSAKPMADASLNPKKEAEVKKVPQAGPGSGNGQENIFRFFANPPMMEGAQAASNQNQVQQLSTGIVIDKSGVIVTSFGDNFSNEKRPENIKVTLPDGHRLDAELIGYDQKTNLAVIKVDPQDHFVALEWGNSDTIQSGYEGYVLSNPASIFTAINNVVITRRTPKAIPPIEGLSELQFLGAFFQTDMNITPHVPGSPIINTSGQIVGIYTILTAQGAQLTGFAITSNQAKEIVEQLRKEGRIKRSSLGVRIQKVDQTISESVGLKTVKGVMVNEVIDQSAAQKAGIEVGDIILKFNDIDVSDVVELAKMVQNIPLGKTVKIVVWRKNKEMVLDVKMMESSEQSVTAMAVKGDVETARVLGMKLIPLSNELKERYNISNGVFIESCSTDTKDQEAKLQKNDVILEIAQEPVKSPKEVAEKINRFQKEGRKTVLFWIIRGGNKNFVAIRLDGESKE